MVLNVIQSNHEGYSLIWKLKYTIYLCCIPDLYR